MKISSSVKYALFAALLVIGCKLLFFFTHSQFTAIGRYAGLGSLLLLTLPLSIAFINKRNHELGGYITLKQLMRTGLGICLFASLLVAVFDFLYFKFIDHEILAYYLSENERLMREINKPESEIQLTLNSIREFYTPLSQATGALTGVLGGGALLSFFISPLIVRNPPKENS